MQPRRLLGRVAEAAEEAATYIEAGIHSLVDWFARLLEVLNPGIADQVIGSGVSTGLHRYAATGLLLLLAVDAAVAAAGFMLLTRVLGLPAGFAAAATGLALVSATALVLAVLVSLPRVAYSSRGSRLEPRFPLLASSLATRLLAGSPLHGAVLELAEREISDLSEFRVELEYLRGALRLGAPLDRVLEAAARITPSSSLKSLFSALAAAARTGAGVEDVIDTVLREYLFNVETEIDRVTAGLGAYMEIFVAASLMLPIAVGVVGLLLAFSPIPGLSFDTLLFATTFILAPMTAAAIIVLADSLVSRIRL